MKLYIYPKTEIIYNIYVDILEAEKIKYKTNYAKNIGFFGFECNYIIENVEVETSLETFDFIKNLAAQRAKAIADLENCYKIQVNKINNVSLKGLSKNATVNAISYDKICRANDCFNNFLNSVCSTYTPPYNYHKYEDFVSLINPVKKKQSKLKKLKRILKLLFK